jgi:hypothetical protein
MLERLAALPVIKTQPVSQEAPVIEHGKDSLQEITAHVRELSGQEKIAYITENEATIRAALIADSPAALKARAEGAEIKGSITVDSDLKLDYIHTKMLWAFNRKNGRVDKVCTTRFDATPMRRGTNKVQFQVMPLSSESIHTFNGTYTTVGHAVDSSVEVEINKRKYVVLSYTSAEICEQPLLRVEEHLLRNSEKLNDYLYDDVLALATPTNFPTCTALVNELKVASNVFDYTHVAKIQEALDSADWPKERRNLILNSKYNLGLMLNSGKAFLDTSATGKPSALVTGNLFAPFGFDYYESNPHVPSNLANVYGFVCVGDAILMASAPIIPTDKARKVIDFQVMQGPNGGIPLMFRDWFSPEEDSYVDIIEVNYGLAVGDQAALVPFVSE